MSRKGHTSDFEDSLGKMPFPMATRFWMGVLQGTKTFRITDQVDSLVLKSRRPTSCDQTVSEILEGAGRSHKPSLANEVRVTALNRPQPL